MGYRLSNFWSHYKTLLLIRIKYHLKYSLHKSASQAKKIKIKEPQKKKKAKTKNKSKTKKAVISLPSNPIYI